MFQSFQDKANPEQGPARLAMLRDAMARAGLDGFLVPRADAHQGEYVAPGDERLAWLTGFTGSAGFAAITAERAGVFVDGRYRTQVRVQTDPTAFQPVDWPETKLAEWLTETLTGGGRVGYDTWLHTPTEIGALTEALAATGITLVPSANLVDAIWTDRPGPPMGQITAYPDDLAGETTADKRTRLAASLRADGARAAVLSLPDSIAWLLNIRGADIPRNPVAHGFAILHDDGRTQLFVNPAKLESLPASCNADGVSAHSDTELVTSLAQLTGPVRLDKSSIPVAIADILADAGIPHQYGPEPCTLPKARKNAAQLDATRAAHLRDGAAVCEALAWLDAQAPGSVTEIDVVTHLEECRRTVGARLDGDTGALLDISFDTIAGSGPNGALAHYRVSEVSNRVLQDGDLLVLDSGGQYIDGTTDITRTVPIGDPGPDERAAFTRVLQGMIAISRLRWPAGLSGRDLDPIARYPLWLADQDYNHGTGHGIGVFLCVHEGPQRISRISEVPLEPGMIVSNEPGYYREGAFGIRIENIVVVQDAEPLEGADFTGKLSFETLNYVPIDRRLIDVDRLSGDERDWLDDYHMICAERIGPHLEGDAQAWLEEATRPL
ncbi:aminopeptidase P family protein [Roseovarius pelagicus]|uniref:Aminopeptidase P family protein n=1 Tax=Roseovarius pelagicus TaxID=2980108 RepID=A0ABY6DDW0_9RHOB|nr:aminopeptidase P family protein [Roseovarius pelagicus]UXX84039.1 aminopeptidase P family protein [Roseovarius pelagicus]